MGEASMHPDCRIKRINLQTPKGHNESQIPNSTYQAPKRKELSLERLFRIWNFVHWKLFVI
jgi:hypothetical protein